jgi:hypothetical protein
MIDVYGWIVQGVMASDSFPAHHYTVGLWPAAGFELVTIGNPIAPSIMNALSRRVVEGERFIDRQKIADPASRAPMTMIYAPTPNRQIMRVANRLYGLGPGHPVRAWQVVHCDAQRCFPWDAGYVGTQPILAENQR